MIRVTQQIKSSLHLLDKLSDCQYVYSAFLFLEHVQNISKRWLSCVRLTQLLSVWIANNPYQLHLWWVYFWATATINDGVWVPIWNLKDVFPCLKALLSSWLLFLIVLDATSDSFSFRGVVWVFSCMIACIDILCAYKQEQDTFRISLCLSVCCQENRQVSYGKLLYFHGCYGCYGNGWHFSHPNLEDLDTVLQQRLLIHQKGVEGGRPQGALIMNCLLRFCTCAV